ncbi:putative cell survival pathways protein [Pichia californica]|uniref:Cell survival pathways protein n=1 Tax=Pichia californica TaxID=460514 RepID=A0A9P6WLM5_9ASCO|nr:putative cell survival pathways protein [[Candida] californica]KAG0689216.1 putative cell survival pathways protein [[Candida] californica]
MWKLVQSGLSVVAGTAEPEYGPDSIHPVGYDNKVDELPYKSLTIDDLKFVSPNHTNVETQTFYFEDIKHAGFAQIIHSNVIGLHTTAQFTFKIFEKETPQDFVWTSTKLENFFIENGTDFKADNLSIILNKDNIDTYQIDSSVNKLSEVHLTVKRIGDGIKFGKDGTTYYGTDIENPWGSMRHVFWPRCEVNGNIILREIKEGQNIDELENDEIEYIDKESITINNGLTMYVMALQGMKPHHAAATWDFLNYQSDNYSVVLMEFTTPPSYNRTKVSVAIVVDNTGKIILGTMNNETKHLETNVDETSGWDVPTKISYTLKDEKSNLEVDVVGDLKNLCERVDVMAEIPQFVKNIVSGVAGTKPYIYQFSNKMNLTIKKDDKVETTDEGYAYSESTFITAI